MNNIWIEGLQGSGKSTLLQEIVKQNPELKVCKEGDYSPVELAWCAWLTKEQYRSVLKRYDAITDEIRANTVQEGAHFIVTYTRILTDIPGFHKDLETYEIYNGRRPLSEVKEIILSRYHAFQGEGYVFECSFLQNLIEDLILFHQLNDDEILELYRELYKAVAAKNFRLLYLYSDNIKSNIKVIQKERSDTHGNPVWYQLMMEFIRNSPYGKKHGLESFENLIAHLEHRQKLELRILKEIVGEEHAVILPSKKWTYEEIAERIR